MFSETRSNVWCLAHLQLTGSVGGFEMLRYVHMRMRRFARLCDSTEIIMTPGSCNLLANGLKRSCFNFVEVVVSIKDGQAHGPIRISWAES